MKKIFYSLLICILLQVNTVAQNYWELVGNIAGLAIHLDVNSFGYVFASVRQEGFTRSTDNGATWEALSLLSRYPYDIKVNNDDVVYASCAQGVYRSNDNGILWTEINNGFADPGVVYCFAFDTSNNVFAGAENGEVYLSENNGDNWVKISNGFTASAIHLIALNANSEIFVSPFNGGVFRSKDYGINWEEINNGLTNHSVRSLKFNSENILFATTLGGAFRSTDNGDNWIQINNGLTSLYLRDLVVNSVDYVFASTDDSGFVYRSTNSGDYWNDTGLNGGGVVLAINPDDYIFAASYLVFRSVNPTTDLANEIYEVLSEYFLSQNYPNPFNPTTTITYEIPQIGFVTLKVYDILGREVVTLVNEEKPAGSYEVQFNGSELTSGIYFYQLKAGDNSETKKMILLR